MKTINVGIIGFGTVGSGTAEVLRQQAENLSNKTGCRIRLKTVADIVTKDLPPEFAGVDLSRDAASLFADPEIDIVVELIGGIEPARTFILKAIAAGKHVVTANKALIAHHGNEIFEAARRAGVAVGFEAAVAGGIPIIKTLREGLAGNRIEGLAGIINGTSNYILTQMRGAGLDFA
ncbi:MAG TPA: homoserine dehydrogenase, partial [Desulfurivibrionaceae bacterium]|nr:homoserine dehydrogenase [Desulfurivibrionaceae bacterium]